MASLRSWWRGIRRADFPLFDTVLYDTTRRYMESHEASMREKMGDVWYGETRDLVDRAETEKEEWHATEPRIWSRFLAALWSGFGISGLIDRAREFVDEGRDRAEEWINDATDRWREEGRISEDEAGDLRHEVSTPRFHRVLPHFGVHLTIGIFTRFPIGTILRPGYVLLNLLLATARLLLRRIDRDKWRQELSIHSPLVLLLAAAPGIGSFSYLASRPIRSNHLLIRLVLDSILVKIPYDLYQRLGWRALVARPGAEDEATTQDLPDTVVLAGIPVRPRQVGLVAIVFGAAIVVAGVIIELLSDLLEPSSWWWPDLTHLFDADTGDALLNLYQVVVVAASILVLLFLGFTLRSSKRTILAFAGVALIILAPLFDEHTPDRFGITSVFKSAVSLDFDDADYLVSLIVTTILVILSVFVAIWFLHEVPEHIRGIFLVGVVCYLGGAVAVETLRHLYGAFVSDSSFIHDALGYVEEATEIAGVVAFLYAVLEYARWSIHMRAKEAPSHES
ncbi:MAG: hypothetical protein R3A46_03470 [Thermomicrobiales bacterium]